jgi:SAM-dependent methyltransferase
LGRGPALRCRHCGATASVPFADLSSAPPSNAYLDEDALHAPELWYPLRVLVCPECWLAQTEDVVKVDELFDSDYPYFSGFSSTWLAHCAVYVDEIVPMLGLTKSSEVIEVGSNDGSLLRLFQERGMRCLGIEPTGGAAELARSVGLEISESFLTSALAEEISNNGHKADLVIANNVFAHVPDVNDFARACALLMRTGGVATIEVPHLVQLVEGNQFDTIYHEHFSYFSLASAMRVLEGSGLQVFDVAEVATHGGSLRLYVQSADTGSRTLSKRLERVAKNERDAGVATRAFYETFQADIDEAKRGLLGFLLDARSDGKTVAAYGAAAKGNTLLNFAGVRGDLVSYVVDRNPAKQGKYLPGSRIPIVSPTMLETEPPDYLLVLVWNIRDEVREYLAGLTSWTGKAFVAIPALEEL